MFLIKLKTAKLLCLGDVMDLIPIYQDDDCKIEMNAGVADALSKIWLYDLSTKGVELSDLESEELVKIMVDSIDKNKIGNRRFTTCRRCPVLVKKHLDFRLTNGFEVFDEALLLISSSFDLVEKDFSKEQRIKLMLMVELYYELQGLGECSCTLFDDPVHKVSGFLTYLSDDRIYLLPFQLNAKFYKLGE